MNKKILIQAMAVAMICACGNTQKRAGEAQDSTATTTTVASAKTSTTLPDWLMDTGVEPAEEVVYAHLQTIRQMYEQVLDADNAGEGSAYRYLTERMKKKAGRVTGVTNADIFCRAQDVLPTARGSLKVRHLGGLWYEASFVNNVEGMRERVPLRMEKASKDARICYVTPYGNQSGDEQWAIADMAVDQTTAEAFVLSFYRHYAYTYATMPDDMEGQLQGLRKQYLTAGMMRRWQDEQQEAEGGVDEGYDAVITFCDFDIQWYRSMKVTRQEADLYIISFDMGDYEYKLNVKVNGQPGEYRIDGVEYFK